MKRGRAPAVFVGLVLLVLLSGGLGIAGADPLVLDPDNQWIYIEELLSRKAYEEAEVELSRFLHFFPGDPRTMEARYLLGLCAVGRRAFDRARETLDRLIKEEGIGPLAGKALLCIGESFYEEGLWEKAALCYTHILTHPFPRDLQDTAAYRLGWVRLKENAWTEASGLFGRVGEGSPLHGSARDLARRSGEGNALVLKDPTTAGVLAGILPGLGHVYTERYRDAAVAFLLNGLFIWAAVEAFDHEQPVLGGILAFLEVGWYTGNVYSAVNAGHKYNRKVQEAFRKGLGDRFDLRLLVSREGPEGLLLTFRF